MVIPKDDMLHGYCTHYDTDGNVTKKGEYDMGTAVGTWMEYNEIGRTQKKYKKKE
jgi:antitoxin component YwqK of YwqJK toxin-antitoxin module